MLSINIKYYGTVKYYYVVINGVELLSTSLRGLNDTIKAFKELYHT